MEEIKQALLEVARGAALPFVYAWRAVHTIGTIYFVAVNALGRPWAGFIHGTVFFGIGQAIAMILLGQSVTLGTFLGF